MKREQQIRAAVKLLDDRGRVAVERALYKMEYEKTNIHEVIKRQQSPDFKRALCGLLSALRRARKWQDKLPYEFQNEFADLKKYEEGCERALALAPIAKPKRDEFKKRLAVREAHDLLLQHGYKPSKTRHKQWYRLSAILYGNRSANLYRFLCELQKKKGPNRVRK